MALELFQNLPLTREQVTQMQGPVAIVFGTNWCGYCQAFVPGFQELTQQEQDLEIIWVEDGSGRALGRSFAVKLWPTVILLRDGEVQATLVRPSLKEVTTAIRELNT